MDSPASPVDQEGKCITINKETWCYDPAPEDKSKCININGMFMCKNGKKERTFRQEVTRFKNILFYPKMRVDEAKQIETLSIEYTIGFIIGALTFTLSLYIKEIIDYFAFIFIPVSAGIFSIIVIVLVLIAVTLGLSVVMYRLQRAVDETNVGEKLAEKSPMEILNTVVKDS